MSTTLLVEVFNEGGLGPSTFVVNYLATFGKELDSGEGLDAVLSSQWLVEGIISVDVRDNTL